MVLHGLGLILQIPIVLWTSIIRKRVPYTLLGWTIKSQSVTFYTSRCPSYIVNPNKSWSRMEGPWTIGAALRSTWKGIFSFFSSSYLGKVSKNFIRPTYFLAWNIISLHNFLFFVFVGVNFDLNNVVSLLFS